MMQRSIQALAALFLLSLVAACTTPIEATTDFDSQFDFSKVRKIAIQPVERVSLSAIRISDMQVARIDLVHRPQSPSNDPRRAEHRTRCIEVLVWVVCLQPLPDEADHSLRER